ncbi:MAG: beta/gamma crystallin-related protein [Micropepsaceae bacterium]
MRRWLSAFAACLALAGSASAFEAILYSKPDFQGEALRITGDIPNLRDRPYRFNDETSSMVVISGEWEIYPDKDYGGAGILVPPGRYPSMEAVLFENNELSSIRVHVRKGPPPPPPKPDLTRKVDARTSFDATLDAGKVTAFRFRGLTAYVTVTNESDVDAAASTLRVDLGKKMSALAAYIAPGGAVCGNGKAPWPAKNGGQMTCAPNQGGDIPGKATDDGAVTCAIPALKAKASARCVAVFSAAYSWLVPPLAEWNIVATADAANRVKEENEKNNGAGEQVRVKGDELPAP